MATPQHRRASARRRSRAVYFRRRAVVFGLVPALIVLVIFLALSSSPTPSAPPRQQAKLPTKKAPTKSRSTEVGVRVATYVDSTRPTLDYLTGTSTPGRRLSVEVRYPTLFGAPNKETTGALPEQGRRFPLIVFAPGFRLRPSDYAALLDAWVRAGFVVAAIDFPDTTYPASEAPFAAGLPHGSPEADIYNEPKDVAFVLGELLAASDSRKSFLHGLLDQGEIALAGHSDGASVVASLVYDANYAASGIEVRAVAALSGGEFPISGQTYGQPVAHPVPLLVVQSATDLCSPPWQAVQLYDAVGGQKDLLELNNATHLGAYNGSEPSAGAVVDAVTVAFFKAAFANEHFTSSSLLGAGNVNGVSEITNDPLAAPIATPAGTASCPQD